MFCENIFAKKNAAALDKKSNSICVCDFLFVEQRTKLCRFAKKQKVLKRLVRQNTFESKLCK